MNHEAQKSIIVVHCWCNLFPKSHLEYVLFNPQVVLAYVIYLATHYSLTEMLFEPLWGATPP